MKKVIKITLLSILILISCVTWYFSYRNGLVTAYSDAQSHLDIARSVIDNRQPGIAQLGSVWLPLNHILFLTLIWNTWAWHSGFAGSFFSMLSYIFGAIGIYKILDELTDNFAASIIGAMAFALNPNLLYLQTTPLTEPLYLFFFIFSALFLIKFIKTDNLRYLLLLGIFGMFQVLTRYDGWFVVCIEGLILIYQQKFIRKESFQEMIGKILIFAMPIVFGITLWFLWNALIFGNPLYFMFGPNSAHTQQVIIQNSVGLITKRNLRMSMLAYWYAASSNIGNYLIALAAIGIALFLSMKSKIGKFGNRIAILLMMLSPVLFNIIALYLGFSILNLPQLHWNPSSNPSFQWFNVRYGILALPLIAVFVGLLAEKVKSKIILIMIALLVVVQSIIVYQQGLITITDGLMGGDNGVGYTAAGQVLAENVQAGQSVLISATLYGSAIFKSGLPFKDFITEGASHEWQNALADPQDYADYVFLGYENPNDSVYTSVFENNPEAFLRNYRVIYCAVGICIYQKRTPAEMFITASGTTLKDGTTTFTVKGVNEYDLAYLSPAQIDASLQNLSGIGVNTIRFWLFGDGNPDGFQITSGIMNESRLENTDYLIADAAKYHIRLIPVLLNNWTDYGGIAQYLKWIGENPNDQDAFYTNSEAIALFENYIDHIIPRVNTVNGIAYSDDPTIMAWEVINEPRFSDSDSQAFVNWFSTIANHIRQKDENHMITVETDTTTFDKDGQSVIHDYCSQLPVDLCTAHLYLYNNSTPIYASLSNVQTDMQQYIQNTNSDGKPLILGEVGVSKSTSPFGKEPLEVLKTILSYNNSSGALIWNWSDKPDSDYDFTPNGTNGVYTLADLSSVLGGIQPSTVYSATSSSTEGGYDISIPGMEPTYTSTTPIRSIAKISTPLEIQSAKSTSTANSLIAPTTISTTTTTVPPASTITATTTKALPYSTDQFVSSDWIDGWGASLVTNNTLNVGSDANNTSGAIFLSGSNSWKDYIFKAEVDWVKGQLFALIARRSDSNDFLECDFSSDGQGSLYVNMYRVFDNQSQLMSDQGTISQIQNNISTSSMEVSMQVSGNTLQCGINNAIIQNDMNIGLNPVLLQGGVGFKTWDPTLNNSQIIVKNISVGLLP